MRVLLLFFITVITLIALILMSWVGHMFIVWDYVPFDSIHVRIAIVYFIVAIHFKNA